MPPPQNNQLQELPYNELSRLSGLRTLNLHNNRISSAGEGPQEAAPPRLDPSSPLPPLCWVCGQLCGSSQNCPLLSRMETQGMGGGGLWLLWTGRGVPGGVSASVWLGAWGWLGAQTPPAPY